MGSWGLKELIIMKERMNKQKKDAMTPASKSKAEYWIKEIDKEIKAGMK